MNSYGDLMTVEVACTWAQRESYVPSARLVVHSCPPVSTSLEPEFGPALEDEGAAWCKRRVYQRDFEVLRPQLSSMHRTLTSCWRVTLGVFDWRPPPRRKARQYSETKQQTCMSTGVPVRFVWTGYADEVAVGGSFNNWTRLFQLKASQGKGFEIVLWLPPGTHEYRYLVDGRWRVDASRLVVSHPTSIWELNFDYWRALCLIPLQERVIDKLDPKSPSIPTNVECVQSDDIDICRIGRTLFSSKRVDSEPSHISLSTD